MSDQVTATINGAPATGGQWAVYGSATNGSIDSNGVYQAPSVVPNPSGVTVAYTTPSETATANITVTSPSANQQVTLEAAQPTVQVQGTDQIKALQQGVAATTGTWAVLGGAINGSISTSGLYQAPQTLPSPSTVWVTYTLDQQTYEISLVISDVPQLTPALEQISPSTLTALSTTVTVTGTGFAPGSMIAVNSAPLATSFIDASHLSATVILPSPQSTTLDITVMGGGSSRVSSNTLALPVTFPSIQVQPAVLAGGSVSLSITGANFGPGDVVLISGSPLVTKVNSTTNITATGVLPQWISGSVVVEVAANDGLQPIAAQSIPIQPTPVTFDAAARFSTQAALGPRPDVVMAIQKLGFDAWITQQMQQPALTFDPTQDGRTHFIQEAITGNSLLRQRVAMAFESFIVPQEQDFDPSATEFEAKMETDAFGNFRQLLTDITADPNLGWFLNLAGNVAATSTVVQPNQNFGRELMQLFTIGPVRLNDDGSVQTDSQGNPLPAYNQDTVIDLTRALTGWTYPTPVNQAETQWGVDWSQPLISVEANHDHGAKLLFGTVALPSGQSAMQDREMALDAIFNHPNVPPFISRLLIQRLVTSNPSPEYIQRISKVFEDNGSGVRGDMGAVIRAILLDPEARAGDTTPSPNDGFLKDPLLFELEAMTILNDLPSDGQPDFLPKTLGEDFWNAPTVFGFYSPSSTIPGTTIISPEFGLMSNVAVGLKSNDLWGIVMQQRGGFTNNYIPNSWLFTNFTTVPAMLDALNHLLYHGTMSAQEREAIASYCSTLNPFDVQYQLQSAVFLALDAESNDVSH